MEIPVFSNIGLIHMIVAISTNWFCLCARELCFFLVFWYCRIISMLWFMVKRQATNKLSEPKDQSKQTA